MQVSLPPSLRPLALLTVGSLMVAGLATAQGPQVSPEAAQQIALLMQEKQQRSSAEQNIDSRLLLELHKRQSDSMLQALPGLQALRTGVESIENGLVLTDMRADVTPELLDAIAGAGGRVVNAHPRFQAVRAYLPLDSVVTLAARQEIRNIRPADYMMRQMINTTEGDVAHGTDVVRTNLNVDGTGVQACAMSDSVDALASLQASGDLPMNVTVLPGQSGNPGSSEGTALLEIIHDMAPGADLFFATAIGGEAQMAQNILDLAAAGCDVIVDDVLYLAEAAFQDGIIAQAVEQVTSQGVLYITSAGNSGNLNNGTSGVWEGDYVATTLPTPLDGMGLSAHLFTPGTANLGGSGNSNEVTEQELNDAPLFTLQWADPFGASGNDYDFFMLDAALENVIAASTNTQNGNDIPVEFIVSAGVDDSGLRLVVVKVNGDDKFLNVNTHRGLLEFATAGQIFGHPGAEGALTVGAVNVATAGGGQFTGGPGNPIEVFSSDGPRTIFFNPDGSPVGFAQGPTKGVSTVVRQKPDISAADGVSTATPGFNPFFGTSASAPHAAGISALYKELFPSLTPDNAFDIFRSNALDIEDTGIDRDSGNGIIMMEPGLDTPIFADGFESGDATSWTDSAP